MNEKIRAYAEATAEEIINSMEAYNRRQPYANGSMSQDILFNKLKNVIKHFFEIDIDNLAFRAECMDVNGCFDIPQAVTWIIEHVIFVEEVHSNV